MNPAEIAIRLALGLRLLSIVEEAIPLLQAAKVVTPEEGTVLMSTASILKEEIDQEEVHTDDALRQINEDLAMFAGILQSHFGYLTNSQRNRFTEILSALETMDQP